MDSLVAGTAGRCGERSERVAAVKISSVRRKAAQKFWAPQQDHRPLRKRNKGCNGRATARVAPTEGCKGCSKAGGVEPRPYGQLGGWYGGPMWASAPTEGLQEVRGRATARVAPTGAFKKCGTAGRCRHRPLRRVTRGAAKRGVGEIGEAPPVAEEASRFRGSAPIGGHNSGRQSVGTTVGNRRPLRKRCKGCGAKQNLPVTALP